MLALLELNLSCCSGLDDCNAAGQLGQTFLQLLAVVVRIRVLDLSADLVDAAGDLLSIASTLNDGRLFLGDDDLAGATKLRKIGAFEREANFFADHRSGSQCPEAWPCDGRRSLAP